MRRFVIAEIIGTGTSEDPYRSQVDELPGVNSSSIIPTDENGVPKYNFALSVVGFVKRSDLHSLTNAFILPDFPRDAALNGMEDGRLQGMKASLEAYDLDGNGLKLDGAYSAAERFEQYVDRIGKQFEPAFQAELFDVAEPVQ